MIRRGTGRRAEWITRRSDASINKPDSSPTPRQKYQDEAVTSKTPRPTPKSRTQASHHLENEDTITLTLHEVQTSSFYQDDAVTLKALQLKPSLLITSSQDEESTAEVVIKFDEEPGKLTDEASIHHRRE